ncbi:MAG: efflux RND transporter periplasmic adaptor subunit [Bacteroidales bacterium]|nr:efflux RND transporter periplasmic adaptor subunit [Bacteroidales bacterium]
MKTNKILQLGLAALLCAACSQSQQQESATTGEYKLMTLKPEDKSLSVSYSAVLQGRQDVEVRPQISGTITQVCVEEGARVRKGQVLFVIDQRSYKAALEKATATVSAAKAALATAEQDLKGKQILHDDKVISDFELQTAKNDYESARAALQQAVADEHSAQTDLSYTEVRSPADGFAGMTSYRVGALVSASQTEPLITVSDNSQMYAYFSMTENQALEMTAQYGSLDSALLAFPEVSLKQNDGSTYETKGKIDVISGMVDTTTGTVSLRAVFDNSGRKLLSGASANVVLPYDWKDCIVIPQEATYELQNKIFAFKVVDGKAVSTAIEVFAVNDGKAYIVTSGLKAGDVIIAEGAGLIKDGTPVSQKK